MDNVFDEDLMTQNIRFENDLVPGCRGGKMLKYDLDKNIFVMNNHRWAFYCWQKYFNKNDNEKITIVHIDAHPDACRTNKEDSGLIKTSNDLKYITNKCLQCDNFIYAFALKNNFNVKIISLVNKEEFNERFYQDEEKFETETFHDEKDFFSHIKKKKIDILDIDLDYFLHINPATKTIDDCWTKEEINEFFKNLFNKMNIYPVITTIATSPFYMSGDSDTICLERTEMIYGSVEKNLHTHYVQGEL